MCDMDGYLPVSDTRTAAERDTDARFSQQVGDYLRSTGSVAAPEQAVAVPDDALVLADGAANEDAPDTLAAKTEAWLAAEAARTERWLAAEQKRLDDTALEDGDCLADD